jgi:hypothetical protein
MGYWERKMNKLFLIDKIPLSHYSTFPVFQHSNCEQSDPSSLPAIEMALTKAKEVDFQWGV